MDAGGGDVDFVDVVVFSGGYDPEEDFYPEPFFDADNSGSPFASTGNIDNAEWSKTNSEQDVNNNNDYDIYNPDKNEFGRGIFVVDIEGPNGHPHLGRQPGTAVFRHIRGCGCHQRRRPNPQLDEVLFPGNPVRCVQHLQVYIQ